MEREENKHVLEGPVMYEAVAKALQSMRINISIRDTSSPATKHVVLHEKEKNIDHAQKGIGL
jgi:hypothetical protein